MTLSREEGPFSLFFGLAPSRNRPSKMEAACGREIDRPRAREAEDEDEEETGPE